jgi:hypothetical protein
MENTGFYRDFCSNFPLIINGAVPNQICRKSKITYLKNGHISTVNLPTILANLEAIKSAMTLANTWGSATLSMGLEESDIYISIGLTSLGQCLNGEITKGKFITKFNNITTFNPTWASCDQPRLIFHFFGKKDPYRLWGYPLITHNVDCLMENMKTITDYLTLRVKESFGFMAEMGGVDADGDEAPILQDEKDKILENWRKNRELLLPSGSKHYEHEISLAEFDKVLAPIERRLSIETGIPQWILFTTPVSGNFELENRSEWCQGEYESKVLPVLAKLLQYQGYDLLDIQVPSFRGSLYNAEVEALASDSKYKDSSTSRNKQMTLNLAKNPDAKSGAMGRKL